MGPESIVSLALTTLLGLVMWFSKRIIDRHEDDVEKLKEEMSYIKSHYLSREDFKEFRIELKEMFNELKQDIKKVNSAH